MKKIFTILTFFSFVSMMSGQVEKVGYMLKYNEATCQYDVYLEVLKGAAKTTVDRIQFNSQISVIVPSATTFKVEESYMPLKNNQDLRGDVPVEWGITSYTEDVPALNGSSVYSLTPSLSPTASYDEIGAGDQVKLFSFSVEPMPECGNGIRLFDNSSDPKSHQSGMNGNDFSQGFTLGGVNQKFANSVINVEPVKPVIGGFSLSGNVKKEINFHIGFIHSNCRKSGSFEIVDPEGIVVGDRFDFNKLSPKVYKEGVYTLIAKDDLGCESRQDFTLLRKTETDQNLGLGESVTADQTTLKRGGSIDEKIFTTNVYPNPAFDKINIDIEGLSGSEVKIQITNSLGELVEDNVFSGKLVNDIESLTVPVNLPAGVYNLLLNIDNKENVTHSLIIVQ